ncbi:MAG TPA: AraC family transcriptional regulator [Stellaceae bacterium]|nr:AraC family transcriptional regulator [Stellaceae bacterium]
MFDLNAAVVADTLTALALTGEGRPLDRIVEDEPAWRALPAGGAVDAASTRVIATRWRSLDCRTREVKAETPAHSHLVAIVLRNEDVRLALSGRTVHDGAAVAGMLQVTEPSVAASCVFRGPYDVLHLHVPNRLIAEFSRDIGGAEPGGLPSAARLTQDPVAERLGRALLAAEEAGNPFGRLYADCISTAIVARLLGSSCRPPTGPRPKVAELARWRLRRVIEYVEANLGEPVSLADLASAAGLTRMHFAAQFRAATGLPPHEYLLRRRVERAQEMLAENKTSLVEIALTVGFQTQSHFTSVFKRFVGQPPRAWRQSLAGDAACAPLAPVALAGTRVLERAAA